jgi:hypothetical protein
MTDRDQRSKRSRRLVALAVGSGISLASAAFMSTARGAAWTQKGPRMPGHEPLACVACHLEPPGTLRQRVQATLRYWLGRRADAPPLGAAPVSQERCEACHVREDRHPTFRFLEPRFARARAAIAAERCSGCHGEHTGRRVTRQASFCSSCHGTLDVADDPIAPSHARQVAAGDFGACLRCHDFHGNHEHEAPRSLSRALSSQQVLAYLDHAESPYGRRRSPALEREVQR